MTGHTPWRKLRRRRKLILSPAAAANMTSMGMDISGYEIDWDTENPLTCPECGIVKPRSVWDGPGPVDFLPPEQWGKISHIECGDCGAVLGKAARKED